MFSVNVVVLLLVAIVSSGGLSESATFLELVNTLSGGLFEIPNSIFGFGYNAITQAATELIECQVKPYEDEDACRNVSQMIRSRGFQVEEHEITTEDGYIIGVQRVINPFVDQGYRSKRRPILMLHEAMGSADDWVVNSLNDRPIPWPPSNQSSGEGEEEDIAESVGPGSHKHLQSLAFYFVNRGYDVFLGNVRGNVYGQRHVSKSVVNPKFWNFSLDEQIDYDLPESIALVQRVTGHKKIGFVGYSLGTTLMFGLQANHPEYADIIEPFIAMAPVVFTLNIKSPFKVLFPVVPVAQDTNIGDLYNGASRAVLQAFCSPTSLQRELCLQAVFEILGHDRRSFNVDRLPTYLHHWPSGSSLKSFAQYAQNLYSKKFSRYNYGLAGNKKRYGTVLPPEYNLTNIRSESIILFTGDNDWLADPGDVQVLVSKLKVKPLKWYNMTNVDPLWSHADFCYHMDVGKLLNPHVVNEMDRFNDSVE